MAGGYTGRVLFVDLTTGKVEEEGLDEKLYRDYIGGYGMGARILYTRQKGGVDALGPENTLGFLTGLLTGTPALFGNRFAVVAKSPLTGGWGDSSSGGHFGPYLKFAGYDAIFFQGISEKPVYFLINDGKTEIRDADYLWGRDTYEADNILRTEFGNDTKIVCVGQAGEKLSLIACVVSKEGVAGRSGLGAVMGSKRLKAVVVKGGKKVPIADSQQLGKIRQEQLQLLQEDIHEGFRRAGTSCLTVQAVLEGGATVRNWSGVGKIDFPEAENLSATNLMKYQVKKTGCWRCPIQCKGELRASTSDYQWEAGASKPEFETLVSFGSKLLNPNLESIIKENDICYRQGLDTISAGGVLALAAECYERGIITKEDTDGIELTWHNHRAHIAMLEKIAKREGFGDILADGVRVAAERIGRGAEEYAIHIGGQESTAREPKQQPGILTQFVMDATPCRHTQGGTRWVESGHGMPDLGIEAVPPHVYSDKGQAHKKISAWFHVLNATGVCLFGYLRMLVGRASDARYLIGSLNAVTGWDYDLEELLKIGDRIATIRRAFNIREGINPLQFNVPGRLLGKPPMEIGPWEGIEIDLDTQVKDYLIAMDWDAETAIPSRRALEELGLDDIAQELST